MSVLRDYQSISSNELEDVNFSCSLDANCTIVGPSLCRPAFEIQTDPINPKQTLSLVGHKVSDNSF